MGLSPRKGDHLPFGPKSVHKNKAWHRALFLHIFAESGFLAAWHTTLKQSKQLNALMAAVNFSQKTESHFVQSFFKMTSLFVVLALLYWALLYSQK